MDRNTVIGFSLIFLILAGYYWYTAPTPEEIQMQLTQDSIARVEAANKQKIDQKDSSGMNSGTQGIQSDLAIDSTEILRLSKNFGDHLEGDANKYAISNQHLTLEILAKGGGISQVRLNEYKRSNGQDLILLDSQKNQMSWSWTDQDGDEHSSDEYFWKPTLQNDSVLNLRLSVDESSYIEQQYAISSDKPYVVDYNVVVRGMENYVRRGNSDFRMDWSTVLQKQEKDMKWELQHSAMVYKLPNESPTSLKSTEEAEEDIKSPLQWFAFKQQYFTALMASNRDILADTKLKMGENREGDTLNIKPMSATIYMAYKGETDRVGDFKFYFGPTHYKTLENTDIGLAEASLERLVPLGWGIFGWVNRGVVIPVFAFLQSIIGSTGIMIMLLTVIIKFALLPLVYKSYISTAKMRILKPEMDAIKEKHGSDMQKVQQENMALYKKAGVSPLSGCVPMLLQLPILFAMFQFFPVAFELRQESFLWSNDLSQWDGPSLGFNIPFYGDHVSYFTLMMTVSTLIYTHLNNQISGVSGQMKYIGYFMPVIFLGVLNDYASGLTWYYFVSNVITFGQQFVIRRFVDDSKLHAQIAAAKKKPVKKSKFQERMELAMKASQQKAQQQQKRKR